MKWLIVLDLALGSLVVFQPILNRLILEHRGLSFAIWLNATVLFISASIFCLVIVLLPERFPQMMRFKLSGSFEWWFFAPGLFGLMLVASVPLMIKYLGASSTVLVMLCGQLATGFLWDTLAYGHSFNAGRLIGIVLAFLGAYLSFK